MTEDKQNLNFESENSGFNENIIKLSGLYQDWFLDYASYVILERAIPSIEDGLKPVQRRILHSTKELDDGRYNKVANIVGNTMKYHPHGDASITDALVQIGQKNILIDTQGNWGNIFTGDSAAAARYIEARLSPFALEVVYSPKITEWQPSYDGRNKEPIVFPIKFPILLTQGVEGIAVGLSTKILPHNFNELIDASIKNLKGIKTKIYPDFETGGIADFSNYNDGVKGGKVKVRAKVSKLNKNTLVVTDLPFGQTTNSLIDSILKANDKGKIKVKKVEDNTSDKVEILIHIPSGISLDKMIDALYAFTNCEISISPLACVIEDEKPVFLGVSEILFRSTQRTKDLLRQELEIQLAELENQWHYSSLERIFIENRIYRQIEEVETWEEVISTIDEGLKPFITHLLREVSRDDIIRLTEIKIKKISKFDLDKAQQHIQSIEEQIEKVKFNIENLTDFAINYFKKLKSKYGKGRERKTEIQVFDSIEQTKVVIANEKLYVNRKEGFIGTSLKKEEFLFECSDIDDIIVFRKDGTMVVTKVESKTFVGKDIIHAERYKKDDKRRVYNLIYRNGKGGDYFQKRFRVTSFTRNREYDLTKGTKGSTIEYFSSNPNGEAEVVTVVLRSKPQLKKLKLDIDFANLAIRSKTSKGNLVTKHAVNKIVLKEEGTSTLKAQKIWLDETVMRLNNEERGTFLGAFSGEDKIVCIYQNGVAKLIKVDLLAHFEEDLILIQKWHPSQIFSCVYFHSEKKRYYLKRFQLEDTSKDQVFCSEENKVELVSNVKSSILTIHFRKQKGGEEKEPLEIITEEFIDVKGISAQGNQLSTETIREISIEEKKDPELEVEKDTEEEKNEDNSSSTADSSGQISLF